MKGKPSRKSKRGRIPTTRKRSLSRTRSGKKHGTRKARRTKSVRVGRVTRLSARQKQKEPVYDFCLAKDRDRWYRKMRQDYKKQVQKREPEESSAIRVDIDIGEQTRKKRRATLFVGHRRFIHLGRLRKFLLLQKGYNSPTINWSRKSGMCQYPKYARIVLIPVHPRGKVKILHSYRLKQPL